MQISLKKVEHYTLKNDNYNKNLEITYKNRKKKTITKFDDDEIKTKTILIKQWCLISSLLLKKELNIFFVTKMLKELKIDVYFSQK